MATAAAVVEHTDGAVPVGTIPGTDRGRGAGDTGRAVQPRMGTAVGTEPDEFDRSAPARVNTRDGAQDSGDTRATRGSGAEDSDGHSIVQRPGEPAKVGTEHVEPNILGDTEAGTRRIRAAAAAYERKRAAEKMKPNFDIYGRRRHNRCGAPIEVVSLSIT